ncbi:hypothetical protein [Saccharopolyspora pogona]|uniref:hypothetical protein n=1 Tax=Saccharopolyspora pogona TaxID=333966 RepID=UPI00168850A7|nr:hypothetical protein [Saccharopolyspora pogona]
MSAPATSNQPSTTPTSTTEASPTERSDNNGQAERPDDRKHDQDKPRNKDRCLHARPHPGVNPHACLSAAGGVLHATI